MRAVDTNVLVRLIARDDPKQLATATRFVTGGVWVSQLVVAETVWVLDAVYDFDRDELAAAIERLLHLRGLTVQEADTVAAALTQFRSHLGLSFTDCLALEMARKAGHLPLGTFDRRLAKLDGAQQL